MLYNNYKHSASSGNLYIDNLSAFVWRYGFRNWGKDSPRANMGKAAEQAVFTAVMEGRTPEWAHTAATEIFDRMHDGVVHEEREAAGPIAAGMTRKLFEIGGTNTRKPREARKVLGLNKSISFEADLFNSVAGIIDLKATLRMAWAESKPANPHIGHIRQQGLYSYLEDGTPVSLLYATPKRVEFYTLPKEQAEQGKNELLRAFEQIERWDTEYPDPFDAVRLIPLNTDTFHWDDEEAVTKAEILWRNANMKAA